MRTPTFRQSVFVFASCLLVAHIPTAAGAPDRRPILIDVSVLPQTAQPKLRTLTVSMGDVPALVEVAITPAEQTTGMMFRTDLGDNDGMLFVFKEPSQASFWMMNCFIPLSVAFINTEGTILEIYPLVPRDTSSVKSVAHDVKYAIEMSKNWFQKNNVHLACRHAPRMSH
jgi:uncharacterized membrane protein (UPF0127 family)